MNEVRTSLFEGIQLNHGRIDWSDKTLDADSISAQLLGLHDHWDFPEFEGIDPLYIERQILFDAKRPNWGGTSKYGKPYWQHFLSMLKLMFPNADISPSVADATMFFCTGIGGGFKKILNLIGCQNSSKSYTTILIAFGIMFIDPDYSNVFVANPFDNAADSTIWGNCEEMWDELCSHHPNTTGVGNADATRLFPHGKKFANKQLDLVPGLPKAGSIVLRNVKHVGKFKGSKARGKDVTRGVMLLVIDEVNEIENMAFLTTLTNLVSQDQFFSITSMNFKDESDLGGRLTEPVSTFGGPTSFDDLDLEVDVWWHSSRSSVTLRFDGHKSPNILSGKTIYPKLFKMENLQRMKDDYGEQSPDYYSQVRSFPVRGDEVNSVLSRSKISSSRHKDTFFALRGQPTRVAFCDPAFGGRDKAMFGFAEFSTAVVTDGEGRQNEQEILVFRDFFRKLKLVKGATYPGEDNYWINRMQDAGIDRGDYTEGAEISYEEQIAIQCRELCLEYHVPFGNFGYDFSMRPDIVSAVSRVLGFNCVAFDYNQGPEGVMLQNIKKDSKDVCKNRNTELAFLAADYFLTKQVRGGSYVETAVTQLSRTLYETVNRKYVSEGKKEYKARWQQVSPDQRDVLMGIAGMAHLRGFRSERVGKGRDGASVWSQIAASNRGKSRVANRI